MTDMTAVTAILTPRQHRVGFAGRLTITREAAGYETMAAFARDLDFKVEETYRRYERGETEPDIALLSKIREVTGVDLNYLVAGDVPGRFQTNVLPLPSNREF